MNDLGGSAGGTSDLDAGLDTGISSLSSERSLELSRERLLLGVAQSCAANGYASSNVEDVLARANVSRDDFDRLFRDLDDCLDAAFASYVNDLMRAATSQYSPDKPLFQVVNDALSGLLGVLCASPAFARMAFVDCPTATPRSRELYQNVIKVMTSLLDQLRVDSPAGFEAPSYAARTAVGGVEALIRAELLVNRPDRLPELLSSLVYCSLVPFLGQDEALLRSKHAKPLQ
jgi:AcrR family transcriptional regulator